eukprot:2210142-Rhodomonas_salina.4
MMPATQLRLARHRTLKPGVLGNVAVRALAQEVAAYAQVGMAADRTKGVGLFFGLTQDLIQMAAVPAADVPSLVTARQCERPRENMVTLLLARLVAAQLARSSTVLAASGAVTHTQGAPELMTPIVGVALSSAWMSTGHAHVTGLHAAPVHGVSIEIAWGAGQALELWVVAAEDWQSRK